MRTMITGSLILLLLTIFVSAYQVGRHEGERRACVKTGTP
jgi:hypothetical protein